MTTRGCRTTTEDHAHHPIPMEEGGADNVMLCDQQANPVYRRDVETLVGAPVDRNRSVYNY